MQAVPGHRAEVSAAEMSMAPAAYISLAEPREAAGVGKAEARYVPHAALPLMLMIL